MLDRKLLFITGKGGVGKSTVAASLARTAVAQGKKVLLCEMDAKGALSKLLQTTELGFVPREISPNLSAMTMNTQDALREYVGIFLKTPFIAAIPGLAGIFDFVADAAPGVKEVLVVGKLCYEVRKGNFDIVIVDAESTGHIVAQVAAPTTLRNFVPIGPLNEQTLWMTEILEDPQKTGVVVVATCEEMAVNEAIDLVAALQSKTNVDTAAIVVNRVPSEVFTKSQEVVFAQLNLAKNRSIVAKKIGSNIDLALQATDLGRARRNLATHHISWLRSGLAEMRPIKDFLLLPDFSYEASDVLVNKLSSELEAELS